MISIPQRKQQWLDGCTEIVLPVGMIRLVFFIPNRFFGVLLPISLLAAPTVLFAFGALGVFLSGSALALFACLMATTKSAILLASPTLTANKKPLATFQAQHFQSINQANTSTDSNGLDETRGNELPWFPILGR